MFKVRELVKAASTQLNDQEYSKEYLRWSRGVLLDYLNFGLIEIFGHRPEAFSQTVSLSLAPGHLQNFPQYEYVVSLDLNPNGTTPVPADFGMLKGYTAVPGPRSELLYVDGEPYYQVVSFAVLPHDPKSVFVSPAVPAGVTRSVTATVITRPSKVELANWDDDIVLEDKYQDCLLDFILARAYEVDMESAQSLAKSKDHYQKAYTALGVKYKQESKYRAGFYLGGVGAGDPQAGR